MTSNLQRLRANKAKADRTAPPVSLATGKEVDPDTIKQQADQILSEKDEEGTPAASSKKETTGPIFKTTGFNLPTAWYQQVRLSLMQRGITNVSKHVIGLLEKDTGVKTTDFQ